MKDILFLKPLFFEKIWGGNKLPEIYNFNYTNTEFPLGEIWGVSGHKNGISEILTSPFEGMSINNLINSEPDLFGNKTANGEFPLQIRIIDAKEELSIQVHPDDKYAMKNSNDNGKDECWYIMDAPENAEIVFGHTCKSREELAEAVEMGRLEEHFSYLPVKSGDFIHVPAGTLHALTRDIMAAEIATSSDTTYRFYDYNRKTSDGKKRELHLKESLDVVAVPSIYPVINTKTAYKANAVEMTLVDEECFTVKHIKTTKTAVIEKEFPYYACFVMAGEGTVNTVRVKKGDFFILTNNVKKIEINGKVEILAAYSK